jgi:hypothetical protein
MKRFEKGTERLTETDWVSDIGSQGGAYEAIIIR